MKLEIFEIAAIVIIVAVLALLPLIAQAAPTCPGGEPNGRGGCTYTNPTQEYQRYPSSVPYLRCSTRLVAGVPVRVCDSTPMPGFRRPAQ